MVQNNKVLTVSYGTFSCTLEGFEDSFDTMKAIAEYFRDLAADDRYFGAEPPQPDAEMLARIAQREVARQVEAHTGANGIHLRAASALPAHTPASAEHVVESAPQSSEPVADEPQPSAPIASAPLDSPSELPKDPADAPVADSPDTMEGETAAAPEPPAEDGDTTGEDVEAQDRIDHAPQQDTPADTSEEIVPAPLNDVAAEDVAPWRADDTGDLPESASLASSAVAPANEKIADTTEARIAAKLKLIRSVVSQTPERKEDFIEDEHAESFAEVDGEDLDAHLSAPQTPADEAVSIPHETSSTDASSDTPSEAEDEGQDDAQESLTKAVQTLTRAQAPQPEAEPAGAAQAPEVRPVRGRIIRVKRAKAKDDLIELSAHKAPVSPPPETEAETAEAQIPQQRPRTEDAVKFNSSLSDEEEADLQAELAALEAELMASTPQESEDARDIDASDEAENEPDQAKETMPTPPSGHAALQTAREGDVSRLMDAAADRLNAEDASTARNTYNQLRAAVAAAKSDANAGDRQREEARARAFREDLQDVVRPRRPQTSRSEGPNSADRPGPLKLVAAQRVDASLESSAAVVDPSAQPVRPRRVRSSLLEDNNSDVAPQEEGAFAAYAADMGAVEMHELLEAAASYLIFVEGRSTFSRPQLINKVRTLDDHGAFSREDSLRHFGQLLREGKLERTSNGRFAASSHIGFRPDGRAAG